MTKAKDAVGSNTVPLSSAWSLTKWQALRFLPQLRLALPLWVLVRRLRALLCVATLPFAFEHSLMQDQKLQKRDLCELHGWHQNYQVIGSGGPGQSPVYEITSGFKLVYQGGVPIGESTMDPTMEQTIPAGSIGLPNDILWQPAWAIFDFSSCNVIYEGDNVAGSPGGDVPFAGADYEECVVTFPCEGNL